MPEKPSLLKGDARKALEKLTEAGVNRQELLRLLRSIPSAPDKPLRALLPLVHGMEELTVHRFSNQVRSWADKIDKVNASPWLTPKNLPKRASVFRHPENLPPPLNRILTPELAETTATLFLGLPGTLQLYASYLSVWLKLFHPTGKQKREIGIGNTVKLPKYLTLQLIRLVRDSVGRPCFSDIALLLDTAYVEAGKRSPKWISEDSLEKLEERNPWSAWLLFEDSIRKRGKGSS